MHSRDDDLNEVVIIIKSQRWCTHGMTISMRLLLLLRASGGALTG